MLIARRGGTEERPLAAPYRAAESSSRNRCCRFCAKVHEAVEVKLYPHEGELYVLAKSQGRQAKETAIRRKRLARLLRKLRVMRKSFASARSVAAAYRVRPEG